MTIRIARAAVVVAIAATVVFGGSAASFAATAQDASTNDLLVTVPAITPSPPPSDPAPVSPPPAPAPGPDGSNTAGGSSGGSPTATGTSNSGASGGSAARGAGAGSAPAAATGSGTQACVPQEPAVPTEPTTGGGEAAVDREVYAAGDTVTATAGGFGAGEQVQLVLFGGPSLVGNFTSDPTGSVTAQFPIGDGTLAGTHTLQFTGWCGSTASIDILVGTTNSASESDVQGVPGWAWWVGGGVGALLLASGTWWVIAAMRAPGAAGAVTA